MKLERHVALVTGASRGIGRAIAMGLAAEGAAVTLTYRGHREEAESAVRSIEDHGGRAIALQVDVSAADSVNAAVSATVDRFGFVDILVNNAAETAVHKPWSEISEAEWDQVLAANLKSCFLCHRAVHPYMRDQHWGRVINISSVTFHLGLANLLHYVSSKGGMIGFTRSLAREVGVDGITVNAITPGAILTEREQEESPDQDAATARMCLLQAIKRRGVPSDIVGVVNFLASDESSFITGQTINVDGGWAMH